jgi:hypothetical protein
MIEGGIAPTKELGRLARGEVTLAIDRDSASTTIFLGVSMNTTIKLSVATALAFGAVAAHASIALPQSGASDAILFAEVLSGTTVVASYAGDTTVSISQLTSGTFTGTVLGSDANLTALFAADKGTDTLVWAVEGGQYTGAASTINFGTTGVAQFITTSSGNSTTKLAGDNTGNLTHWSALSTSGTAGIGNINTNIAAQTGNTSTTSTEGSSAASAGVWDSGTPSGIEGWYGNGPITNNTLGGSENLYYVTGNGGTTAKVSFSVVGTASLSSSGLAITGSGSTPPPVPLPPAVWLLGSGLLGLAGVARRKSKV